jgi:D-alanyl-D-alanine carboxypeptidase (penicillin-binding protein 5/6)
VKGKKSMNRKQNLTIAQTGGYKKKKRKNKMKYLSIIVFFVLICMAMWHFYTETLINDGRQEVLPIAENTDLYNVSSSLNINSSNALLVDLESEKILFDKNSTITIYPASMTKILTAITVLEHVEDLNEEVILNNDMFNSLYYENASMAGFLPGEGVSVIDLLYGLLLPSGGECAVGLAEYVSDSESGFVSLMNKKAQEIGMINSHFINTTGLHDENNYTTAKDMAVLLKYALNNDIFYKIFTSNRHSSSSTNKHEGGITYYSTLFSKIDSPNFKGGSILGGKTGYTPEAGQCLASLAVKDEKYFILVTAGADGDSKTQKLHIDDAFAIYSAIYK